MAEPQHPNRAQGAKSGVAPGSTPAAPDAKSGPRPVDEEDVFGGAERTDKNESVRSKHAKP